MSVKTDCCFWWNSSLHLDACIIPMVGEVGVEEVVDEDVVVAAATAATMGQASLVAAAWCESDVREAVRVRVKRILSYRDTLRKLLSTGRGIVQRTPQWYEARKKLITASDAAQAIGEGKFGTRKQFFERKVDAIRSEVPTPMDTSIPPLQWGIKYEPVAAHLYEHLFGTKLHEFGLMIHPDHPFIGASPDGISDGGVMVEIKCPFRRVITGEIPAQYYMQMQLQMHVCGLLECDYIECEMREGDDLCGEPFVGKAWQNQDGGHEYAYGFGRGALGAEELSAKPGVYFAVVKHNVLRVRRDDTYVDSKIACLREAYDQLRALVDDPSFLPPPPAPAPTQQQQQQQPPPTKRSRYAFKPRPPIS